MVEVIRAPMLAGIPHGFLGRVGGVSTGIHAGLNVGIGSDDEAAAVAENRARAIAAVRPGARLLSPYQVHSSDCVTVTTPFEDDARPHADALVTDRPGLALGIVTADCAPVLLADVQAGVIGAAHAGWKGALGGVTDATIQAMEALGAQRDRIAAAIGPCIARAVTKWTKPLRAASRPTTRPMNASSPKAARAISSSTWKPMSRTASPPPG